MFLDQFRDTARARIAASLAKGSIDPLTALQLSDAATCELIRAHLEDEAPDPSILPAALEEEEITLGAGGAKTSPEEDFRARLAEEALARDRRLCAIAAEAASRAVLMCVNANGGAMNGSASPRCSLERPRFAWDVLAAWVIVLLISAGVWMILLGWAFGKVWSH